MENKVEKGEEILEKAKEVATSLNGYSLEMASAILTAAKMFVNKLAVVTVTDH